MASMFQASDVSRRQFILGGAAAFATLATSTNVLAQDTPVHIVIAGSGAAGISIANRLSRALKQAKITIIDGKQAHYYWPGLTLVATGAWPKSKVLDENRRYLPKQVEWVQEMVASYDPDNKQVITDSGRKIRYDYLVVATGVEYHYDAIEGMDVNEIGQNGLTSVYHSPDAAERSWHAIERYSREGGNGYFTLPSTPIRCAGAPLKMTLLTLDRLRQNGGYDKAKMHFYSATNNVFGLPWFNDYVLGLYEQADMGVKFRTELTAIDSAKRVATFKNGDETLNVDYDLLHVVPPMRAPKSVRESNLAWSEGNMAAGGWLAVDKDTLQHITYPEVFGCGDVNGTPRGKTAATVKMSVPIVVENLLAVIAGNEPTATFNGYTSCPLLTKFGSAMLIEFDYNGDLVSTYSFIDPKKESWLAWVMKEQLLKPTYLQMLKGNV
jgi:sulfide:quinone oxidoreductase